MTTERALWVLVGAVCLVALGYAAGHWYPWRTPEALPMVARAEAPPVKDRIEAQGRLEPVSGTLSVSAIPGEEIVQLEARVGQWVLQDSVLAVLGSHQVRLAELELAERQLDKAKRQYAAEQSLADLRQEVAEISRQQAAAREKEIPLEESLKVGRQRLELAQSQLDKLEQLKRNPQTQDAVADAELEQQRLLVQQITVELDENEAKRAAAQEVQALAKRAAELDVAMAATTLTNLRESSPVPVLEQSVALAKLAADASVVRAPSDGRILEVYVRQGERVTNTPILLMGDLREMVCVAEVHEGDVKLLELKPPADPAQQDALVPAHDYAVTLRSNALEQDLHGRVIEIGRLVGAPALRDPNPLAPTDRRTVRVRILLDEASTQAAQRFVQLQVNVTIHLQRS